MKLDIKIETCAKPANDTYCNDRVRRDIADIDIDQSKHDIIRKNLMR